MHLNRLYEEKRARKWPKDPNFQLVGMGNLVVLDQEEEVDGIG
jgi:hypothetical protein